MKKRYDKELDIYIEEPETVLEAVDELEEFLCTEFGANDWSVKFLHIHFKICKDEIKRMESGGKMVNLNLFAKKVALKEKGKKQIDIAQIKEILKITFTELAKLKLPEVAKTLNRYKK